METSQKVVGDLFRGKKAERVALMDSLWPETLVAWVAQGYPMRTVSKQVGEHYWRPEDGRWEKVERAGVYVEPEPVWRQFDYDMVNVEVWFDWHPLRDYDVLVQEQGDWEIRQNGAGASLKFWKHRSGTPEHIGFRMISRDIWERDYRPHLLEWDVERLGNLDEPRRKLAEARAAQKWTYFGHQFIWENMRQSLGDMVLYESLLLDPAWIHDYCRVYTDMYKRYYTYLLERVGKPDGFWLYEDLGYNKGLFASPKVFRELIFPYFQEMVDFFHQYDLPVVLHSCGSTAQALPLIAGAGFDALNPLERKAKDNDPLWFAEHYGDRLAFVGGLDVRVFETNDRDVIRREIAAYIDGMKARGARLVFASDHSIPPTVSYATYQFILEVYREHMMY